MEEVTEVVSDDSSCEALIKQEREQKRERMKYEKNRLDSFDPRWLNLHHMDVSVVKHLAKAGFYHDNIISTECFSCGLKKHLLFWQKGPRPREFSSH